MDKKIKIIFLCSGIVLVFSLVYLVRLHVYLNKNVEEILREYAIDSKAVVEQIPVGDTRDLSVPSKPLPERFRKKIERLEKQRVERLMAHRTESALVPKPENMGVPGEHPPKGYVSEKTKDGKVVMLYPI